MNSDTTPRIPVTAADYLEWVFEASSQYPATGPTPPRKKPAMTDVEKHGCAHCFAAVYHPTSDEKRRGICDDCHSRTTTRHAR